MYSDLKLGRAFRTSFFDMARAHYAEQRIFNKLNTDFIDQRTEAFNEAFEQGKATGLTEGKLAGRAEGEPIGFTQGIKKGLDMGLSGHNIKLFDKNTFGEVLGAPKQADFVQAMQAKAGRKSDMPDPRFKPFVPIPSDPLRNFSNLYGDRAFINTDDLLYINTSLIRGQASEAAKHVDNVIANLSAEVSAHEAEIQAVVSPVKTPTNTPSKTPNAKKAARRAVNESGGKKALEERLTAKRQELAAAKQKLAEAKAAKKAPQKFKGVAISRDGGLSEKELSIPELAGDAFPALRTPAPKPPKTKLDAVRKQLTFPEGSPTTTTTQPTTPPATPTRGRGRGRGRATPGGRTRAEDKLFKQLDENNKQTQAISKLTTAKGRTRGGKGKDKDSSQQ